MIVLRGLVSIASVFMLVVVLWDIFQTIVLPRPGTRWFRPTLGFFKHSWRMWSRRARRMRLGRHREEYLALYGPLSLVMLLMFWALGLVLGYGALQWALALPARAAQGSLDFGTYLYFSGTTFFTLGLGDVIPNSPLGRTLVVVEVATGFGVLGLVITYLPVLYGAFSDREVNVSLLSGRAGSPPSAGRLLQRIGYPKYSPGIVQAFLDWERWSANLLEHHLSYPSLAYFRSQRPHQSWLAALTTVLDTSALFMVGIEGLPGDQAEFTFAMAQEAAVWMTRVFAIEPGDAYPDRLPAPMLAALRCSLAERGIVLQQGPAADQRLADLRSRYEPYVHRLSEFLLLPLPSWMPPDIEGQGATVTPR